MADTTLIERIDADSKAALKAGNRDLRRILAFLYAEAKAVGKDAVPPRETTDEEVVRVIRKLIVNLEENVRLVSGGAPDAIAPESATATAVRSMRWQVEVLQAYLPPQMDEAELRSLITAFVTGQNWTDEKPSMKFMGSVMSMLRECQPGKYDPAMASRVAREILAGS